MNDSKIFLTEDGSHSILSDKFGVTYHSKHGAIQETQHVFIDYGLKSKLQTLDNISILEIGFGTGLNALMTLLEIKNKNNTVDFHTYEAYPISINTAKSLNYPNLLHVDSDLFLKLHQVSEGNSHKITLNFSLTKYFEDFHNIDFLEKFDIIYFDAYGPGQQPELWDQPILKKMFAALKTDGILTTYCAQGAFKRNLKAIGFTVEAVTGPPGKREMTIAKKNITSL